MKKVLLLTGPGGVGKTTISDLLQKRGDYQRVDGDQLDTEFFPKGDQWLPQNIELLRKAHRKIFKVVKDLYQKNDQNIVLDYIIFGDYLNFVSLFQNEFGNNFEIKVLFPNKKEIIKRDLERECWITGQDRINDVYAEFEKLKSIIGEENYLDTGNLTPQQTVDKYFT